MRLILAFVVLCSTPGFSQQNIQKQPAPAWVEPVAYVIPDTDTLEETGGYHTLLIDRQFNVIAKEAYRHIATKVMTESGLEKVSAISINFEPSFESVYFHTLLVKRGTEVINKLPSARFEILRREQNLDRLIYDKSLDAILNLDDIQVGDVVEYSYTVRGFNPVFNGRFTRIAYFNYSEAVGKIFTRVITASDRRLAIKVFNDAEKPNETTAGGKIIYTWSRENVPALAEDDTTPAWYDSYDNVEISEYNSWSDINAWAMPLYATSKTIPEVDKKLAEIRQHYTALDEQINACIRFVQDEIRYLSFSDGIRGYKPHDPAQTIRQRFGDCKDKSLLLTYMLRKLGISAHPALVNTSTGKMLTEQLPSPTVFDHCIAEFTLNDSTYWIDATQTLQRGTLKQRTTPNYYQALVIGEGTTGLTPMRSGDAGRSLIQIREEYRLEYIGGPAQLIVQTIYTGAEANSIRNYWKSNSAAEIKKNYTNFYANEYPGVKADSNIVFTDDEERNIITSRERYTIKDIWRYDSAIAQYAAEFYPRSIADYLQGPSTKSRSMPLAVTYPAAMNQTIVIYVPEEWDVPEDSKKITSPAFVFTAAKRYTNKIITLSYGYQALNEWVSVEQIDNHIRKIDEAKSGLVYSITWDTKSTSGTPTLPAVDIRYVTFLILLAVVVFLAIKHRSR